MYRGIYAYPWDLADEGLAEALGRIRDTGVNTVTLAVGYQSGRFLRPHGRSGKVTYVQDGMVYFRARPERYGHIKPRVHAMVDEFDGLSELQRAAPDLNRAAWVVCGHNTPLGEQHPEYVARNAFGDPYVHSLCPAHPAVRDYLVNLCSDLAHGYDLAAVVLETPGWLPYDPGDHRGSAMVPLDRRAKTLLSLCFADATRRAARAAGVDADRLQAQTREMLERQFAAAEAVPDTTADDSWPADLLGDPEWAAFFDWRCGQVADLVTAVKAALPAGTALAVIPSGQRPGSAWLAGYDLRLLAAVADALEIPACHPTAEADWLDASDVRRRAGHDAVLNFILRPSHPDPGGGARTVEAALRLRQVGMTGIAFYSYGLLPLASLTHIKAALAALEAT